jgi:hypothetical protein
MKENVRGKGKVGGDDGASECDLFTVVLHWWLRARRWCKVGCMAELVRMSPGDPGLGLVSQSDIIATRDPLRLPLRPTYFDLCAAVPFLFCLLASSA